MSLTLEPDYFISSNGLPKLNCKKYRKYDKKSNRTSKENNREQVCCDETNILEQRACNRLMAVETEVGKPLYKDCKKLLTRRQNMQTTASRPNCTGTNLQNGYRLNDKKPKLLSDKELKCAINQKIKLFQNMKCGGRQEISKTSNEILDNRLATSAATFSRRNSADHETDAIVLSTSFDF